MVGWENSATWNIDGGMLALADLGGNLSVLRAPGCEKVCVTSVLPMCYQCVTSVLPVCYQYITRSVTSRWGMSNGCGGTRGAPCCFVEQHSARCGYGSCRGGDSKVFTSIPAPSHLLLLIFSFSTSSHLLLIFFSPPSHLLLFSFSFPCHLFFIHLLLIYVPMSLSSHLLLISFSSLSHLFLISFSSPSQLLNSFSSPTS